MRIRNRQVPFPLSDPNLVQLTDATVTSPKPSCTHSSDTTTPTTSLSDHPQPSDHQSLPPIRKPTNGFDDSPRQQKKKEDCLVEEGGEGHKGNDTRKESMSSEMSSEQDWRWCKGEKAFPLKKRRGSFENNMISKDNGKKKIKTKEVEEMVIRETKREVKVDGNNKKKKKKKKVRGGAVMEGSRCSRVNGRGWRCCQPTLVGYSLCEHHLGKGRLRSMTSVRNNRSSNATSNKNNLQDMTLSESSSVSIEKKTMGDSEEDNGVKNLKVPIITGKKRMKVGMVKARSISSLLGQTNTENNK